MRVQVLLFCLVIAQTAYSGNNDAITQSQRALYSYPEVKTAVKNTEKLVYGTLGVTPEQARYLLVAAPLIEKKISTKRIKNMGYRQDFRLRPDVEYDMRTKEIKSVINFGISF